MTLHNAGVNNSYSKWLGALLGRHGITQTQLAKLSDVPQPTVQRILSGETKNPMSATLQKLAAAVGENWESTEHAQRDEGNVRRLPGRYDLVPLISWVQAGGWMELQDPLQPGDAEDWLPCPSRHSRHTFALTVVGDSMTGTGRSYPEGTVIFVDPERRLENGSRVIARVRGDVTFKVYSEDMGRKFLRPLNTQYPTIEIENGTEIVGVVIGSYMPE